MTETRIVWELPDGSILTTNPASGFRRSGEPEDKWLDHVAQIVRPDLPKGTERLPNSTISSLPSMDYQKAWRSDSAKRVVLIMSLARNQKMQEIRSNRDRRFISFDKQMRLATDRNDKNLIAQIAAKREILRSIPQTIDLNSIFNIEALISFDPAWPE